MDTHSRYTVSLHYDRRLYRQDIAGSVAHARMLGRQGIIGDDEAASLVEGLEGDPRKRSRRTLSHGAMSSKTYT